MTVSAEVYARIASNVYLNVAEEDDVEGTGFVVHKILDDNASTGYFGAIYYNAVTEEIIVAHRGTEGGAPWEVKVKDFIADAQMAFLKVNEQKFFAYSLMQQALELAATLGARVTVTGHSLGGALAQLSAAEYGVSGETFNAYGAAGIADAGASANIINHMRVTDLVAVAGKHLGTVKLYATQDDVLLSVGAKLGALDQLIGLYNPGVTHSVEQFFDGSMDGAKAQQRYAQHSGWFAGHRVAAGAVIQGFTGGVQSLAELRDALTPEFLEALPKGGLDALMDLLNDSYVSAEQRVFLGSDDVDSRSGTGGVDVLHGGLADDLLSGQAGTDHLFGEAGNDTLRGGADADHLYGGADNDYLDGGSGNDRLEGGAGFDRYDFWLSDFQATPESVDTILDSDGAGRIEINSVPFAVGQRLNETTWESFDGSFLITADPGLASQTLSIKHMATGSAVLVQNWANGALGIQLGGDIAVVQTTDLTDIDDSFGEPGSNGASDAFNGLAGNDGLEGGAGDDVLDGGLGADLIFGGSGNDRLFGGEGNDFIIDGSALANLRPLRTTHDGDGTSEQQRFDEDIARLGASVVAKGKNWYLYLTAGGAATGNATQDGLYTIVLPDLTYLDPGIAPGGDDVIDAGAGSDRVYAGEGDDVVLGGGGDDYLNGGHDNDIINGGEGNDEIDGDLKPDSVGLIAWVSSTAVNAHLHSLQQGRA